MAKITAQLYTQKGEDQGSLSLPETIFGLPWNADLMHQVIVAFHENKRFNTASAKDRSEVRGGGKKPWRQKGTGRARHGSRRSPIWIGGGVTHGPSTDRVYGQKINKKVKVKALYVALSQKLRDGQMLFVDKIMLRDMKTKVAHEAIVGLSKVSGFETLDTKKHNNIFIIWPDHDEDRNRSFQNLPNVTFKEMRNVSAFDIAQHRYIIVVDPKRSLPTLEARGDFSKTVTEEKEVANTA